MPMRNLPEKFAIRGVPHLMGVCEIGRHDGKFGCAVATAVPVFPMTALTVLVVEGLARGDGGSARGKRVLELSSSGRDVPLGQRVKYGGDGSQKDQPERKENELAFFPWLEWGHGVSALRGAREGRKRPR